MGTAASLDEHVLSPHVVDQYRHNRADLIPIAQYLQKISENGYYVYDARPATGPECTDTGEFPSQLAFVCLQLTSTQKSNLIERFESRNQSFCWFDPLDAPESLLHAVDACDTRIQVGSNRRFPLNRNPAWCDTEILPEQKPFDVTVCPEPLVVMSLSWDCESYSFWKLLVYYCNK